MRKIEYVVNINGITPTTEQFGGTQGDHRITELEFTLSQELYGSIKVPMGGKLVYRFDVYDGEGGVWSSEEQELSGNIVTFELEERHTRFGGKITVYLIITILTPENETNNELYSFPANIRLKNRPEGVYQQGENYESISSLAQKAAASEQAAADSSALADKYAGDAYDYAQSAKNSANKANEAVTNVETTVSTALEEAKLSGEFDGTSVTHSWDGTVLTVTSASGTSSADLKGEKGEKGDTPSLEDYYTKEEVNDLDAIKAVVKGEDCISIISPLFNTFIDLYDEKGVIIDANGGDIDVTENKIVNLAAPDDASDAATKGYVDDINNQVNGVISKFSAGLETKQDLLESSVNIKTINGDSILGEGDMTISGGTTNYSELSNKPRINGVELSSSVSSADLGINMSLVKPTVRFSSMGGLGDLSDGVYIATLNKITMNVAADATWFQHKLEFDIGEVVIFFYGQCTEEDLINGGIEVGKKYRMVKSGLNIYNFAQVATTLEDKADKDYVDSLVGDIEPLLGGI